MIQSRNKSLYPNCLDSRLPVNDIRLVGFDRSRASAFFLCLAFPLAFTLWQIQTPPVQKKLTFPRTTSFPNLHVLYFLCCKRDKGGRRRSVRNHQRFLRLLEGSDRLLAPVQNQLIFDCGLCYFLLQTWTGFMSDIRWRRIASFLMRRERLTKRPRPFSAFRSAQKLEFGHLFTCCSTQCLCYVWLACFCTNSLCLHLNYWPIFCVIPTVFWSQSTFKSSY